jgi:hypothetical protein
VQSLPRPPASVPLGGSLRASRAAQLACPSGPLAAVDLADGRALLAELRGSVWVVVPADEVWLEPSPLPTGAEAAPEPASPTRRRRLGTFVALAAALGAAAAALATGLAGSPPPAVAGPTAQPRAEHAPAQAPAPPPAPRAPRAPGRGGRAVALPPRQVLPPPRPAPKPPPAAVATSPPVVPPPPPLPELPSAPAL